MKQLFSIVLIFFTLLGYQNVYAQDFSNGYYLLTTKWQGRGKALDVVNDGNNDKLILESVANVSGQAWKFTPLGNGYYRLTNQWQGEEKALDVVNDGTNNQLQMANSANVSGQAWKLTDLGNGYYRLTNQWLGEGKALDIVNDGKNDQLQMASVANVTGQAWKITLLWAEEEATDTEEAKLEDFKAIFLHGFKVMVRKKTEEEEKSKKIIAILSEKLEEITNAMEMKHLNLLRKFPIWVEFKKYDKALAWYHLSEDWLAHNGYPVEMVNSVEICGIANFIDFQENQPYNVILHELGHAYHNILSKELKEKIAIAYENAVKSGKYEQVPDSEGQVLRHYALENESEYFAELTATFFGRGYYVPFTREELKKFDPMGYALMLDAWK